MIRCCCGCRTLAPLALFLAFLGIAGCGGGGRSSVQGTVTYDGQPVDDGGINFIAAGGGGEGGESGNASGDIREGKYSIDALRGPKPGKYKVEIYWNKKTGKMIPTPGDPDVK